MDIQYFKNKNKELNEFFKETHSLIKAGKINNEELSERSRKSAVLQFQIIQILKSPFQ